MTWTARALPWLPALIAGILLLRMPFLSPDSFEMAMVGQCLWALPFDSQACQGLSLETWPPGFALLAGPLVPALGPAKAAFAVTILGSSALVFVAARLAQEAGSGAGLATALWILAIPPLWFQLGAADARFLGIAAALGAWSLCTGPPGKRPWTWFLGGLLGAAAVLARTEMLATVGLLGLWMGWRQRHRAWPAAVGLAAVLGPYWLWVSLRVGRPALSLRGWEQKAMPLLLELPQAWVLQLLGANIGGSPLQRRIAESDLPAGTLGGAPDPSFLLGAMGQVVPPWLWPVAILGTWVLIRARAWTPLLAASSLCPAAIAVAFVPQAQDPLLPANNLVGLLVALAILAGPAIGWLSHALPQRAPSLGRSPAVQGLVFAALMGAAAGLGLTRPYGLATPAQTLGPGFLAAAGWLQAHTSPDQVVAATFETGGVVHQAGRPRTRVPAWFETGQWPPDPQAQVLMVISALDRPWTDATLSELAAAGRLRPLAHLGEGTDWVLVFSVLPTQGGLSPAQTAPTPPPAPPAGSAPPDGGPAPAPSAGPARR